MKKTSDKDKLFSSLEHIKKETEARNDSELILSDLPDQQEIRDNKERISQLLEACKAPNGYVDVHALVYDMHGVLSPDRNEEEHKK